MPRLIPSLEAELVVCLSVGAEHSMILTEAGSVYSFGDNCHGQLGLDHLVLAVCIPSRVTIEAIRSVCAGYHHTAAITREGGLFTWGSDLYGQQGHDDTASVPFQR